MSKIVLVTGSNRGLGRATALALARRGFRVYASAKRFDEVCRFCDQWRTDSVDLKAIKLDVNKENDREAVVDILTREEGRLDVLINNAGVNPDGSERIPYLPADQTRLTNWEIALNTNCVSPYLLTIMLRPLLVASGSANVVNVSSLYGLDAHAGTLPPMPSYSVSKAGLNNWTRCLASLWIGEGIRVNAVNPGRARTEMGGPSGPLSIEEGAANIVNVALLTDNDPTGMFFDQDQVLPWGERSLKIT